MQTIPKIIWMVWFQGAESLPPVAQACLASWKTLNPTWEIRILDKTTLTSYVDVEWYLSHPNIPPQALSDIVRIFLLKRYGGVWIDASVFCAKPLDEWIHEVTPDGFFAFSKPRGDKLIDSWFLIASQGNYIVNSWFNAVILYWVKGPIMHRTLARPYHRILFHLFLKRGIYTPVKKTMHLTKRFGFFPYFWFHYLFDEIYHTKPWLKEMWDRVPQLPAAGPNTLVWHGLRNAPTTRIKEMITSKEMPVYKLDWRIPLAETDADSTICFLIDQTLPNYLYK